VTAPHALMEALRPLSPYERLFWAIDRVNGFNFSIAVTFRGAISHADWIDAFAQVQKRHPLLSACVGYLNRDGLDDPHAPVFMRTASRPIPLNFRQRTGPAEWQRVMEAEQAKLFDPSIAPFLRATLLEDGEGCDLVVTANHVVLDGVGAVAFVGDLLAALAGETLPVLPVALSAEERIALSGTAVTQSDKTSQAHGSWQHTIDALPVRTFTRHTGTSAPTINALRLSPRQSAQMLGCSHREQATVGSLLIAAVASALQTLSPPLRNADIRMNVPIDARPYLDNAADFVLSIIGARCVAHYPTKCLWESARAIRSQLAPWQSFVEIESTFNRMRPMMAMNLDSAALIDTVGSKFGHDVILTNLKHVHFPLLPDGLTVEAVWGPSVLMGYAGEHTVGATTFDGALHLLYTSHSPVAGLLEKVQKTIAAACAEARVFSRPAAVEEVAA